MNAPMANLPVVIFQFAMSPYDNWVDLAWAARFIDHICRTRLKYSAHEWYSVRRSKRMMSNMKSMFIRTLNKIDSAGEG